MGKDELVRALRTEAQQEAVVDEDDRKATRDDFRDAVNMSPKELEDWLATEQSQEVGWTRDGQSEATGHKSGRQIVEIKRKKVADLTDEDYAHMRKVVGYVHRHMAQRPSGDVSRDALALQPDELGPRPAEVRVGAPPTL